MRYWKAWEKEELADKLEATTKTVVGQEVHTR